MNLEKQLRALLEQMAELERQALFILERASLIQTSAEAINLIISEIAKDANVDPYEIKEF